MVLLPLADSSCVVVDNSMLISVVNYEEEFDAFVFGMDDVPRPIEVCLESGLAVECFEDGPGEGVPHGALLARLVEQAEMNTRSYGGSSGEEDAGEI